MRENKEWQSAENDGEIFSEPDFSDSEIPRRKQWRNIAWRKAIETVYKEAKTGLESDNNPQPVYSLRWKLNAKNLKIILLSVLLFAAAGVFITWFFAAPDYDSAPQAGIAVPARDGSAGNSQNGSSANSAAANDSKNPVGNPDTVTVHIIGAVNKPGLHTLPASARVADAVKAAGGAQADAVLEEINLAAPIQDGEQINIPHNLPACENSLSPNQPCQPKTGRTSPQKLFTSPTEKSSPVKNAKSADTHNGETPVSINRASEAQLQQIPGVGPTLAKRIVNYRRQNGLFRSAEQLVEVPGIGQKLFVRLRSHIQL